MPFNEKDILFEDGDFIIVNKSSFQPCSPDKSGDLSLLEELIEMKKLPPEAGVIHRLDRPVRGAVLFAVTPKGTTAFNRMLRERQIQKSYLAVLEHKPPEEKGELNDYILKKRNVNKSIVSDSQIKGSQKAVLKYRVVGTTDRYTLAEIDLITGRHHQIRAQFGKIGCPVKGDVKYGAKRTNKEGGIMLMARSLEFIHPFSGERIRKTAPLPPGVLWDCFPEDI